MFQAFDEQNPKKKKKKNHKIETYKIDRNFLSYFDDKIYILNNGFVGLAVAYEENVILH